ncbi:LysR family transcriptional regulator [Cellvibrio polysaccharolyticus]|uniref:LysR family transcriptional regulator n=1 Tax=Cellvibrio polysaccharolyticus TaxID=2082724 RepID=A0A928V3M8_9GAMM|nr:LysR family transcriptional regulator [Cellvibrio polysaccharolyticus]MBE8718135.1 LysR family transcriptional regulator [Cellvibrio polysaccharolyticus]
MNMSLESLSMFVQVASVGSFSAAARQLGKSQSTVSEAIAKLEIDLDVVLFDRTARKPVITDAGALLLQRAQQVLAASTRMEQTASLLSSGLESRVTLVISDVYQSAHYEPLLEKLARRYPDLNFECVIAEDADVLELVGEGRASIGILAAQPTYPPALDFVRLAGVVHFDLYVGQDHALTRHAQVTTSLLAQHRSLKIQTINNQSTASHYLPEGRSHWSAPDYLLLLELAVKGYGWAELPVELVERFGNNQLQRLPVKGWPRQVAVDVIRSKRNTPGPAGEWLLRQITGE